jgi:hypothetical protein
MPAARRNRTGGEATTRRVLGRRRPLRVGQPFLRATRHAEGKIEDSHFVLELLRGLLLNRAPGFNRSQ